MRSHWPIIMIVGLALAAGGAHAQQNYPNKPIRLIVPFATGGPSDIAARMQAPKSSESFGVPVVVDNRPGAAGTVGAEIAVRAAPDGYTMLSVSSATYTGSAALYRLPYDPVADVTPLALIGGMLQMMPHVRSKRLRGIAVTAGKRSNAAPEIPPVSETVPGYEAVNSYGVVGPKALPREIVMRWNKEMNRIAQLPDIREYMGGTAWSRSSVCQSNSGTCSNVTSRSGRKWSRLPASNRKLR